MGQMNIIIHSRGKPIRKYESQRTHTGAPKLRAYGLNNMLALWFKGPDMPDRQQVTDAGQNQPSQNTSRTHIPEPQYTAIGAALQLLDTSHASQHSWAGTEPPLSATESELTKNKNFSEASRQATSVIRTIHTAHPAIEKDVSIESRDIRLPEKGQLRTKKRINGQTSALEVRTVQRGHCILQHLTQHAQNL